MTPKAVKLAAGATMMLSSVTWAAVNWLDLTYDKALAEAARQRMPLMLFIYVADMRGEMDQTCQRVAGRVLRDPRIEESLQPYLPVRINATTQPEVLAQLGLERSFPALVCVENDGKLVASIHGAAEDVAYYLVWLGSVAEVRRLEAAGARNGPPEQRLQLADAYFRVDQPKPALQLYRDVLQSGALAPDQRYRVVVIAAFLDRRVWGVNSRLDDLNAILQHSRARNPSAEAGELDALWTPEALVYHPIVFESKDGTKIGVLYKVRDEKRLLDWMAIIETLARQMGHPEQLDAEAAYTAAESLFELENAEASLAFYRRALQAGGLRKSEQERAGFQIGQCLGFLERWEEATRHLEQFIADYKASDLRPAAMLILAAYYREWGDSRDDNGLRKRAEQVLVDMINTYAKLAKHRDLVNEAIEILHLWDPNIKVQLPK